LNAYDIIKGEPMRSPFLFMSHIPSMSHHAMMLAINPRNPYVMTSGFIAKSSMLCALSERRWIASLI
jgi:hypothetical protein